jgi:hypothetical protein
LSFELWIYTMHNRRTLLIILLGLVILSQLGYCWGNTSTHQDITKAAIEDLPYQMATTFRPYKTWLANTSTDAGVRTGWDPHESYFHYIDIDTTPPGYLWPFTGVPRNLTTYLSATQFRSYSAGVNPYALSSITVVLSTAYRNWNMNKTASNFTTCLYWMTRISHYCGDLHQPLHVTWNYDPDNGLHSRYESDMLKDYNPTIYSKLSTGMIYQSNPLEFCFSIISVAYPYYPKVVKADTTAYNIAHSYNSTYYYSLWTSTQSFTTTLLNLAAKDVASLWYTAWINAGLTVPVELSQFEAILPKD